jgi:hypothetical protein
VRERESERQRREREEKKDGRMGREREKPNRTDVGLFIFHPLETPLSHCLYAKYSFILLPE